MGIAEIVLIAIGLAMDAFAVSLSAATAGLVRDARSTFRLSFHFGLFQFIMPVIGWFLGTRVEPVISSFDHWIAFGLLSLVGGKMVFGGFKQEDSEMRTDPSKGASLILLSVATSIDALAIGISLAMLEVAIWYPGVIIGLITGFLSFMAIRLGKFFGQKIGANMEFVGGIILIGIGLKILLSHL